MDQSKQLTPRAREMYAVIEKYSKSDLSQKEFCEQHGITYSTFHWWRHQYKKHNQNLKDTHNQSTDFIPVQVTKPVDPSPSSSSCQIEYPNGIIVHLKDVNVRIISELIRCLEQ